MLTIESSYKSKTAAAPKVSHVRNALPPFAMALVLYALFLVFLEYRLSQIRNTYTVLCHNIIAQRKNIEILILGSSHSQLGINPRTLARPAANIASYSQSLELDKQIACKLIPDMPNLKLVIVPISYFTLDYRLSDSGESWRDCYYSHFWGVSERPLWERLIDPKYWLLTSMYGSNLTREVILNNQSPNLAEAQSLADDGWWTKEPSHGSNCTDVYASNRAKYHLNLMHSKYRQGNIDNLLALVSTCADRGIKVAFVTMPTMRNYRSYFGSRTIHELEGVIQDVAISKGIVWKNFSSDNRFDDKCFLDCDHMNMLGASRFSSILNEELINGLGPKPNGRSLSQITPAD